MSVKHSEFANQGHKRANVDRLNSTHWHANLLGLVGVAVGLITVAVAFVAI